MLVRTTLRIEKHLKKNAEKKALQDDVTLQEVFNKALEDYLEKDAKRQAKKIVFKTHDFGVPINNLKRGGYYPEPKFK